MPIGLGKQANGFAIYRSIVLPWSRCIVPRGYATATNPLSGESIKEASPETQNGSLSGRIHLIGLGNIGCFVAHSLASRKTRPPITLLLHNREMYREFVRRKRSIALMTNGLDDIKTGFDVNVLHDNTWHSLPHFNRDGNKYNINNNVESHGQEDEAKPLASEDEDEPIVPLPENDDQNIECLIISTKAQQTVRALSSVSHRLSPESTILFLQNGMGVIDEVNKEVFPDPSARPHYLQGIISHGIKGKRLFHIEYNGLGTTILGALPSPSKPEVPEKDWAPSMKYLLRTLTLTSPLVAVVESPINLFQYQLEKLAMNCVINSFTVLLDAKNGELLYNYHITRSMRLLLAEVSTVICALPELEVVPGVQARFATERLRQLVTNIANKTAANTSSMLQDVQAVKRTEIEYINGYIVRRGDELGIRCALNYMIMQLVLGRNHIQRLREAGAVPLDTSPLEREEE